MSFMIGLLVGWETALICVCVMLILIDIKYDKSTPITDYREKNSSYNERS